MANHIRNRISLPSDEAARGRLLDLMAGPEGTWGDVDFNGLIPMPENVYRGPLGSEEMERYPGEMNWYDWSIAHWGTKWNAWDSGIYGDYLEFTTAWNGVSEIVARLSEQLPGVPLSYYWADEDIGFNVGGLALMDGAIFDEDMPEEGSAEAVALAREIWGIEDGDEEEEE